MQIFLLFTLQISLKTNKLQELERFLVNLSLLHQ